MKIDSFTGKCILCYSIMSYLSKDDYRSIFNAYCGKKIYLYGLQDFYGN